MPSDTTGPAADLEEANEILSLMRDPKWKTFAGYIGRIGQAADKKLRRLDNSPERNGYFKGVIQVVEDICENIPEGFSRQIEGSREPQSGKPTHQEWV